tara:strand:+ start:1489 stop:3534 length:2046 start_codon:yes stop_codon:yes gene_type:complete
MLDDEEEIDLEIDSPSALTGYIQKKFEDAENGRLSDELRWISAYKNYRGITDSTTAYTSSERSKVFVRITKVKVLAAFGQISDILFASGKFPITVSPTPIPEGIAEFAHLSSPEEQSVLEQIKDIPLSEVDDFLGGLESKYGQASNLVPGPSIVPQSPEIQPALIAARNMEKQIHDQLTDTNAVSILRKGIFECALLGTGIIKGPFNFNKTVHNWKMKNGKKIYTPSEKIVPRISSVSCWDFYPDPSAKSLEDSEYVVERHRLNNEQILDLKNRPFFKKDAIEEVLSIGPNYSEKHYENILQEDDSSPNNAENRYEVLEYWGSLPSSLAEELDISDTPSSGSVQVNVWIASGKVIRAVLNPFLPTRLPYSVFPYEINPYQMFGVGVAENMEDSQLLMNGHIRMAIDNLSLAGNMVFDVDETQLVPGQSMDIYPGKIFRRQTGQPGTAVTGIKFPNTAPENLQMYQAARQLADEETGIPSIIHGQTGVTGTGRTAAGLSMIMGSAGLSIKTVIKNIDEFLLRNIGEAFFQWNMQFNDDNAEIRGDLEIKPKGISSVMQKEVRTQRLTALLQTIGNPMLAPFIKIPNLIRELAISQDIDPDQLVNNPQEAAIFADILRGLNERVTSQEAPTAGQQPPNMGTSEGVPSGPSPVDQSGVGGGTIGTGNAPSPGESNFTGNIREAS